MLCTIVVILPSEQSLLLLPLKALRLCGHQKGGYALFRLASVRRPRSNFAICSASVPLVRRLKTGKSSCFMIYLNYLLYLSRFRAKWYNGSYSGHKLFHAVSSCLLVFVINEEHGLFHPCPSIRFCYCIEYNEYCYMYPRQAFQF